MKLGARIFDERAASLVEYTLLVALIAVISMGAAHELAIKMGRVLKYTGQQIQACTGGTGCSSSGAASGGAASGGAASGGGGAD
jgi:Flp pilus assembly pilin Flp